MLDSVLIVCGAFCAASIMLGLAIGRFIAVGSKETADDRSKRTSEYGTAQAEVRLPRFSSRQVNAERLTKSGPGRGAEITPSGRVRASQN